MLAPVLGSVPVLVFVPVIAPVSSMRFGVPVSILSLDRVPISFFAFLVS